MEVGFSRNIVLISSRPPRSNRPARKTRAIAMWGSGETTSGTVKQPIEPKSKARDKSFTEVPSLVWNDSFIDETTMSNVSIEKSITVGSINSTSSTPIIPHSIHPDKWKDFNVYENQFLHSDHRAKIMDVQNEKSEAIQFDKPTVSLHTSATETVANENVSQAIRSNNESAPAKSISCSELTMKHLKSSSCTDIDGKTLFFNEKGWPVKVMKLTEDSPPKTMKPRSTRSVPATSSKKSPNRPKEKSIYTQKKSAVAQSNLRTRTELLKEDKENKKTESAKDVLTERNTKIIVELSEPKETVEKKIDKAKDESDLKSMLKRLDETIGELTSVNKPSEVKVATNKSSPSNKSIGAGSLQRSSSLERKKTQNDNKKDDVLHSARSNKYNSKEVKAYMQAKRVERKIQMSEETRKKQNMLEMQKKNLEKLREKALQVLKKSSAKSVDEDKPKWQGPLEVDDSEVLPPAIHIFENKIPTARKSKVNVNHDESGQINIEKEFSGEVIPSLDPEKDYEKSEEIEVLNTLNENGIMDSKKTSYGLETTKRKLRLSKSKPSIENPPLKIGMEAAAMEIVPQLQLELENARRSLESQMQSPKLSKDRNFHNVTLETNETANEPLNSRRTTFIRSPRESDFPCLEEPRFIETSTKISDHMDISPTNSHRKRHHLSFSKTNNSSAKKLCANSSEEVLNNKVSNSIEEQLRRIQEVLQKENREPDKLLSHIKPDGFSIMNVMKMKLLASENKYFLKTNVKEKVITTKNSFDDDTDAPSIISMEEDFRPLMEPLRLSDLQLKLDRSSETSVASQLSMGISKTSSRRNATESLKSSSVSSYTLDAPPLVVPESVQNLKLSSNRSHTDISFPSQKVSTSHSSALHTKCSSHTPSSNSFVEKPVFLSHSSSSVSKSSQGRLNKRFQDESVQPELFPGSVRKDVHTVQGSNPAALFLQFHAELSRLDAFDQSLAQVIAAERLHSLSAHVHVCNRPARADSVVTSHSHLHGDVRQATSRSRSSQYSSAFEQPSSEPKASPVSEAVSVKTVSQHDRVPSSRSPSSLHSVVEQISPVLDHSQSDAKEVSQKQSPFLSSSSSIPFSFSPKSIHILKVLIDDAQFQRKQVELMYKTQEDILSAQYKAELSEIDMRYRTDGKLTNIGVETRRIVEEKYETPLTKLRQTRDQALSNSDARIEYLEKQISWLKKQKKGKGKPRSAEASPKKLTPLRSISLTSVVENSSSSESSVGLQTFDDKKRQEVERDKSSVSGRRKIDREMLWRLQEELARVQELQKVDRSLKSSRSRRDKSTSPLEMVQETSTKDVACSVNEDEENISHQATSSSLRTVEEARSTDVYNSESFESPESSETPRQPKMMAKIPLSCKPFVTARPNNKSKVLIKVPLSPRVQVPYKRRGSSGSDESLLLSQNETQSEQSDYEVRISALKEQKRQRFAELNRLQRELKRAQREQLKATEAALVKQIQAYEMKIVQTKKQLEEVTATTVVRPQIKHPRVSDKFFPRTSDVFQKAQVVEEPPKQLEQNASDIDTNSLKSISEASSTETTIQSSGVAPATETSSKPSVEVEDETKDILSGKSEATEALSSVATETDGPTVFDTQKSDESEIPDLCESVVKPEAVESGNISNAITWMDAAEFFNQEISEKLPPDESKLTKPSFEKSVSSSSPDTNISEELSNEPLEKSKSNSSSQEFHDAEEIATTLNTESFISSTKQTSDQDEKDLEEVLSHPIESPEKDDLVELDTGRVTSVVSQSPSNTSPKSVPESLNTDLQSVSHTSLPLSKPESDDSQYDDEVNISNVVSEKSEVSEVLSQSLQASVVTGSNVASKCSSTGEENSSYIQSEEEANCNSSQSEVIKVFLSNKTQESKEKTEGDNNNVNLNETYVVSASETDPDKDESIVDNITDQILQNLLNECLVCKKNDKSIEVRDNTQETDELRERLAPAADNESNTEILVNDFTQTVLNKFVKDATDCMIQIKDAKKAAQIKSICTSRNKKDGSLNDDVSSNKLLEALALERKISPNEKGRDQNITSPKYTRNSNEVELSEGNESEVLWVDEELPAVSLQAQREAEELRLKQLQIEQEIEQIKQLEAQESIPYYYLREIPNKPPPPYTPPGQSVQTKQLRPEPTRRENVEQLVSTAMLDLLAVWRRGGDLSAAKPTEEYQDYNKFLFDLVKEIFVNVTSNGGDEEALPPWERTGCGMKRLALPELTEESISKFVLKKVRVLFGFEPDSIKENLIIQWSRKKRDRVDELLVRESQEEERDWTDYSKYEVAVKNNVALSIFDNLLEETGKVLSTALQKKLAYCQQLT